MLPSLSSQHLHHRRRWRHCYCHLLHSKTTKNGESSYHHHFFCSKEIEDGDENCHFLLLCYNKTTEVLKHKAEGIDNSCRHLLCCNSLKKKKATTTIVVTFFVVAKPKQKKVTTSLLLSPSSLQQIRRRVVAFFVATKRKQ